MQLSELYPAYFLHQCENHPDLQHQDSAKVFGMIDVEEAFGDFRQGVKEKGYLFRLINFTYAVTAEGQMDIGKMLTGGWIIAKYFSPRAGGETEFRAALADCERINDSFIEKIVTDSRNGHPLWFYSMDSEPEFRSQSLQLTGDGAYCGWRTVFTWYNSFTICDPADQVEWLDGGITPH